MDIQQKKEWKPSERSFSWIYVNLSSWRRSQNRDLTWKHADFTLKHWDLTSEEDKTRTSQDSSDLCPA